ncbi:carbohydrate ABC transporter permease [Pullulanibacillus sp. KACC 23026]|uniref:carbohydrate ABC transporter permease n=1 Tax=Pullulanibacillus sp. KACC 23026 TaxID=3028315 RepID=UPI0023AFB7BC|nr:carbohydrate ABC transporter permease [Pullulanibacillus sp. KACC 23026]WEG11202.1 carbohydrate ABC transporter permease [Pullulanibacillus sp. KACC 23026]
MIESKKRKVLLHIFLIVLGVIWIYPFLWMISASFKTNRSFFGSGLNLIPKVWHWENYTRAWQTAHFAQYFLNSVIVTVSTVIIVTVVCALTGYALGRVRFPGRRVAMVLIAATMFIPKGYTIIPLFEIIRHIGLMNNLLGVIVAESAGAHVLYILLFTSFFSSLPDELEDAAAIDGCGFFRTFWRVMLPLSGPVIATTAIMQFIWSWNAFLEPLIFTLNRPDLRTLAVGMYSFVGEYMTDYTGMTAGATISLIPIMLVFIFMQRYFVEGIAGAVKQ